MPFIEYTLCRVRISIYEDALVLNAIDGSVFEPKLNCGLLETVDNG